MNPGISMQGGWLGRFCRVERTDRGWSRAAIGRGAGGVLDHNGRAQSDLRVRLVQLESAILGNVVHPGCSYRARRDVKIRSWHSTEARACWGGIVVSRAGRRAGTKARLGCGGAETPGGEQMDCGRQVVGGG